jgi:hypothetical protein
VKPEPVPVPRLSLRVGEAARALGISEDTFTRHVAPELRWIRRGATKLVAVTELQAWLEREAHRTLNDD